MTRMSVENMDANLTLQQRATVFRIAHLMSLYNVWQVKYDAYTMRGWTYVLLSCVLFLKKSEAAALLISAIDVPTNHVTGEILLEDGLPRFLYVLIRHSKTDQEGQVSFVIICDLPCKKIRGQARAFACSRTLAIIKIMHVTYAILLRNFAYKRTLMIAVACVKLRTYPYNGARTSVNLHDRAGTCLMLAI